MAKKPCLQPGCPVLVDAGRCTEHRRAKDKARGTRHDRGYDAAYDAAHREYQRRLDAGEVFTCWRCAELGKPHPVDPRPGRWHLGHSNEDRSVIRGPQCPSSNLSTASITATPRP